MSPSRTSRSAVLGESVSLSLTVLEPFAGGTRRTTQVLGWLALAALLVLAAAGGPLRVGRADRAGTGDGLGRRAGRGQYAGCGRHLGAVRLGLNLLGLAGLARSAAAAAARSLAVAGRAALGTAAADNRRGHPLDDEVLLPH